MVTVFFGVGVIWIPSGLVGNWLEDIFNEEDWTEDDESLEENGNSSASSSFWEDNDSLDKESFGKEKKVLTNEKSGSTNSIASLKKGDEDNDENWDSVNRHLNWEDEQLDEDDVNYNEN